MHRIQPTSDGYFVMQRRADGTWTKVDFFTSLIDAQRQYPDAEIDSAEPLLPENDVD